MERGFDLNFLTDDELEQEIDELIEALREPIENDDRKVTVLNALKLRQIQFAYAALRYLTKDSGAVVTYKLYEPFKTMGSVSVEGESLEFTNPEWFARVAEFASNTEIYPLTKNGVRLTFTFHGLTAPIE